MQPYFRYADIRLVPSTPGVFRASSYPESRSSRNDSQAARAADSPAGGRAAATRGAGGGVSERRPVVHGTTSARGAGARQPCSRQARAKGENTLNGVPSPLVTRPGVTAYGEPVRTRGTPPSAFSTASSRSRP